MQKVGAPGGQGQARSRRGALGRSGVVLLTYVLAALELTCLFLQFSSMPVSTLPQAARPAPSPSSPLRRGPRSGLMLPRAPLAGGPLLCWS